MNSEDKRTNTIVLLSLFTAVIAIVTIVIVIPIPNLTGAYINAGDAAVYTAAYVLGGPWSAAISAAVGSALADLFLGSVLYMPATFVIKGTMALIAAALMKRMRSERKLLSVPVAGLVMPLGYFLYECAIIGQAAALAGLPFNLIQYVGGAVLGMFVIRAVAAVQNRKGKER